MVSGYEGPPVNDQEHELQVDAEALKKYTLATDGSKMQATCDLVPPSL